MTTQHRPRTARREPRPIPPAVFEEARYMDGLPYETTRGLPDRDGFDEPADDGEGA